jgi:hypothetical protein
LPLEKGGNLLRKLMVQHVIVIRQSHINKCNG